MSGELTALLLKALRALSPEERDRVMAELLDARLQPAQAAGPLPAPPPSVLPHALPGAGEHVAALRESLALEAISPREREVLALMAEGRSNAAIAAELVVTDGAVEKHVSNIFAKLGLPATASDHRRVLAVLTYLRG